MPDQTILVVDDEKGIVSLCERLLKRANFSVLSANDTDLGVEIIKDKKIDLLLVDIRMPKMDGFQLIEIARRHQPDMGAVIMTGFGTLETAIRALKEGADGLILKPFEKGEELVQAVRHALEERRNKQEIARLQAIRPLLDITETMFSETRKPALQDLIINAICGHLRCANAGIYYQNAGEGYIELIANRRNSLPEEESSPEGGPLARACHWKTAVWINSDGPGDRGLQAVLKENNLGSVLCTPVERDGAVYVFMAGRAPSEPAFQVADLDLFGILARQADVALENARLYSELRAYVRQVEESQRALTQAEKMAAVGRLTASIAHEVNNPLQSVRNCLHLAERPELNEEERESYMQLAKDELERLMLTVQRMLDFYRPGALERKPTDIVELVKRVLKLLDQQLANQNVNVSEDFPSGLPVVTVVSNQLQQVFFNIILNAMEAMPNGGELKISGKRNNNHIEISFEDTGTGVPHEKRQSIFEPFNSTREDGTGLGLSVTYGILTAHGGTIELLPSEGEGACFQVSLPIEEMS
ncbi:MAG: response regulator [Chloroflexi bacterium]|nr:response regulator [Chloroflexota bacterium]